MRYIVKGQNTLLPTDQIHCGSPGIKAEDLERPAWSKVSSVIMDPQLLIARLEEQGDEQQAAFYKERLDGLEVEIGECQRERGRWDQAFGRGLLELDELTSSADG